MELTLYHYVHCPFCIRVRMAAGHLNLTLTSRVLPYNDEKTPVNLTGKKMLPIMTIKGKAMNESLDIIAAIDVQNVLRTKELLLDPDFTSFNDLLSKLGTNVHNLAMPYWIYTPEFDDVSRCYFQKKKEEKRGPFKDLVKKRKTFEDQLQNDLTSVEKDLTPFYKSENFTLKDILLAAHIWGLYVVPEFQFSVKVHKYLQTVKEHCHFDYHRDFWS